MLRKILYTTHGSVLLSIHQSRSTTTHTLQPHLLGLSFTLNFINSHTLFLAMLQPLTTMIPPTVASGHASIIVSSDGAWPFRSFSSTIPIKAMALSDSQYTVFSSIWTHMNINGLTYSSFSSCWHLLPYVSSLTGLEIFLRFRASFIEILGLQKNLFWGLC